MKLGGGIFIKHFAQYWHNKLCKWWLLIYILFLRFFPNTYLHMNPSPDFLSENKTDKNKVLLQGLPHIKHELFWFSPILATSWVISGKSPDQTSLLHHHLPHWSAVPLVLEKPSPSSRILYLNAMKTGQWPLTESSQVAQKNQLCQC